MTIAVLANGKGIGSKVIGGNPHGGACMREYTVSQDENGYWYAHMVGYPYIPCFGSFSKSKRKALQCCADHMCMTYSEYMAYRKKMNR